MLDSYVTYKIHCVGKFRAPFKVQACCKYIESGALKILTICTHILKIREGDELLHHAFLILEVVSLSDQLHASAALPLRKWPTVHTVEKYFLNYR